MWGGKLVTGEPESLTFSEPVFLPTVVPGRSSGSRPRLAPLIRRQDWGEGIL